MYFGFRLTSTEFFQEKSLNALGLVSQVGTELRTRPGLIPAYQMLVILLTLVLQYQAIKSDIILQILGVATAVVGLLRAAAPK